MDLDPSSSDNILFYTENGMKFFEGGEYVDDSNAVILVKAIFSDEYELINGEVRYFPLGDMTASNAFMFDLDALKALALKASDSICYRVNGSKDTEFFSSLNDDVKDFDALGFKSLTVKEDNYMYMDSIDKMVNFLVNFGFSKSPAIMYPVVFRTIEEEKGKCASNENVCGYKRPIRIIKIPKAV